MRYKKNNNLIEENIDEFKLLYDCEKEKNHFLNETAGIIWEMLPCQFENLVEFKTQFIIRFSNCTEIGIEELENDFFECIECFLEGGLIYVYNE